MKKRINRFITVIALLAAAITVQPRLSRANSAVINAPGGLVKPFITLVDYAGVEGASDPLQRQADEALEETNLPPLQQAYADAVLELKKRAVSLQASGMGMEQRARILHAERQALDEKYKALTPPDMLEKIYQRNIQEYGDKNGPTIDRLRQQGKSWKKIIAWALRP